MSAATPTTATSLDIERALLLAWRDGCEEAGATLIRKAEPVVRRFLVHRLGRGAEDAFQEAMCRGLEARDRFDGRSSFRTYLTAVAWNVSREIYRKRDRRGLHSPAGLSELPSMDSAVDEVVARRRDIQALLAALDSLPTAMQSLLYRYYWDGWTASRISRVLAIPENTVRSRLRRGRDLLRKALTRPPSRQAV